MNYFNSDLPLKDKGLTCVKRYDDIFNCNKTIVNCFACNIFILNILYVKNKNKLLV